MQVARNNSQDQGMSAISSVPLRPRLSPYAGYALQRFLRCCVTVACLSLVGCDKFANSDQVGKLEGRVAFLESRVNQQAEQLARKPVPTESWVLWKRFVSRTGQDQSGFIQTGPAPFMTISAYEGRSACMDAAKQLVSPGGRTLTSDPLTVAYADGTQEFACLPKGVTAGFVYK